MLNVARRRIITRAVINPVYRVRGKNSIGAQEGLYCQELPAVVEGVIRFSVRRNRQTDALHNVRIIDAAVVFKQCSRLDGAVENAGIQCEELRRRASFQ